MHISTQLARLAMALALVATVAAVATPAARSGHQDLGYRGDSLEQIGAPDAIDRYLLNNAPSVPTVAPADASDALSRYLANNRPDAVVATSSGTTFDWSDVGIGVGGILAILLLACAAAFVVRERRARLITP